MPWMRVLKRTVVQEEELGPDYYRIYLELSRIPGETVLETITLDACNAVVETSERNAVATSSPRSPAAGEVWRYTITNPLHYGAAVTASLGIGVGSYVPLTWTGYENSPYDQGFPPPTSALPTITGTFVIPGTGVPANSTFGIAASAGYYGFDAGPMTDECWRVVYERLS